MFCSIELFSNIVLQCTNTDSSIRAAAPSLIMLELATAGPLLGSEQAPLGPSMDPPGVSNELNVRL